MTSIQSFYFVIRYFPCHVCVEWFDNQGLSSQGCSNLKMRLTQHSFRRNSRTPDRLLTQSHHTSGNKFTKPNIKCCYHNTNDNMHRRTEAEQMTNHTWRLALALLQCETADQGEQCSEAKVNELNRDISAEILHCQSLDGDYWPIFWLQQI